MKLTNRTLVLVAVALVGYGLYRRYYPGGSASSDLNGTQTGDVTEYTVVGCDCYRVDNHLDGTQTRTRVDRGYCHDDYTSPSLAHCGGA